MRRGSVLDSAQDVRVGDYATSRVTASLRRGQFQDTRFAGLVEGPVCSSAPPRPNSTIRVPFLSSPLTTLELGLTTIYGSSGS